jgi:1-acyl-sn-glycerol-3-phosphate acyltransferase
MSNVPPVAGWFQDGFHRFLKPYLRRHFHAVAAHADSRPAIAAIGTRPLIVYGNHPSWWDPLVAHFLCRNLFAPRQFFAPIDAAALQQYQVFRKLGFFGIDLATKSGAAAFLKTSLEILSTPKTSLWLTPEGRFADCRDWSAPLMPGLSHLCTRMPEDGVVVALALEYVFWNERLPLVLLRFSPPLARETYREYDKGQWNQLLTQHLRDTQAALAADVQARSAEPFETLLSGTRGAGGTYDTMRRLKSVALRRKFRAEHGEQFR